MKKIFSFIYLFLLLATAYAQPQGINYQAVARNTGGAVISNQNVGVRISIIDGTPTGILEYAETFNTTTNQFGLFNIVIGSGTPTAGSFSSVTWSASSNKYVKVEVDPAGGTSYIDMGTNQLQSVPYALYAPSSGVTGSGTANAVAKYTGTNTLGNSSITDDGTTTSVNGKLNVTNSNGSVTLTDPNASIQFPSVTSSAPPIMYLFNSGTSNSDRMVIGHSPAYSNWGLEYSDLTDVWNFKGAGLTGVSIDPYYSQLSIVGNSYAPRLNFNTSSSGGHNFSISAGYGSGDFTIDDNTSASTRMYISAASGFTGFGTTIPECNLQSSNTRDLFGYNAMVEEQSSLYSSFALRSLNGGSLQSGVAILGTSSDELNVGTLAYNWTAVNASAFNISSDRSVKKDIISLGKNEYSSYLTQIRNIESATYRYNWEDSNKRKFPHIGFIAQSLPNEVLTKMNEKADGSGRETLGYNLSDMIGLSVMGIKAIDDKTQQLEALIQAQQEQINLLKKEIEQLKSK